MPARAADHDCLVPDCPHPGRNQIGVRCRVAHSGESPFPEKRRTDAIFSVESAGFLCDAHALAGGRMHLIFEPDASQQAALGIECQSAVLEERVKPIRQPLAEVA
jgi:hypothetical protein